MHVSIGHAARLIGVSVCTLRRWEREGYLIPSFRTAGQHRRYLLETLEQLFSSVPLPEAVGRTALAYARVSTRGSYYLSFSNNIHWSAVS